jgi:hypothetical protein
MIASEFWLCRALRTFLAQQETYSSLHSSLTMLMKFISFIQKSVILTPSMKSIDTFCLLRVYPVGISRHLRSVLSSLPQVVRETLLVVDNAGLIVVLLDMAIVSTTEFVGATVSIAKQHLVLDSALRCRRRSTRW